MSKQNHKENAKIIHLIVQFFSETFVAMALGYFFGKWLDGFFFPDQTILTIVFLTIGVFAGLRNLIIRAIAYTKGDTDATQDKRH
ncbi:MAG: AtpZ/AtpI family protein [Candidatus Izemoplasmatales bacterium]|nr:AtpZ/AtpI family protein [bacterium]MDZ4196412.1 AtpZ/AtpI family protein [Candidatus Izemoplasmatales bacterium]